MPPKLYDELVHRLAANKALIVVGTGASLAATRNHQHAGWVGLIKDGLQYCDELQPERQGWLQAQLDALRRACDRFDVVDLVHLAGRVEQDLGGPDRKKGHWRTWLRQTVGSLRVSDSSLRDALHLLGRGRLATCNYDDLLRKDGLHQVPWTDSAAAVRVLAGDEGGIVHLHGHWATPESVVFGRDSYEALRQDSSFQAVQRAIATMESLVFVGFGSGLHDYNIGGLLDWVDHNLSQHEHHHFRLVTNADAEVPHRSSASIGRLVNVPYGETHADLAPFLARLAVDARISSTPPASEAMHPRPVRVVVFDFGGTLTKPTGEMTTWERMWAICGYTSLDECRQLHADFKDGKITHQQWCDKTMHAFRDRGFSKDHLDILLHSIQLVDGVAETIAALEARDIRMYIVSGSLRYLIHKVLGPLHESFEEIRANDMVFDDGGQLRKIKSTLYDFEGKAKFLRRVSRDSGVPAAEILFIGNSSNDIHAHSAGVQTLVVNPRFVDPNDRTVWKNQIRTLTDLRQILPFIT